MVFFEISNFRSTLLQDQQMKVKNYTTEFTLTRSRAGPAKQVRNTTHIVARFRGVHARQSGAPILKLRTHRF